MIMAAAISCLGWGAGHQLVSSRSRETQGRLLKSRVGAPRLRGEIFRICFVSSVSSICCCLQMSSGLARYAQRVRAKRKLAGKEPAAQSGLSGLARYAQRQRERAGELAPVGSSSASSSSSHFSSSHFSSSNSILQGPAAQGGLSGLARAAERWREKADKLGQGGSSSSSSAGSSKRGVESADVNLPEAKKARVDSLESEEDSCDDEEEEEYYEEEYCEGEYCEEEYCEEEYCEEEYCEEEYCEEGYCEDCEYCEGCEEYCEEAQYCVKCRYCDYCEDQFGEEDEYFGEED